MPRDDARRWSRKIERMIKTSAGKDEELRKKETDEDYHSKMLEKIRKAPAKQ